MKRTGHAHVSGSFDLVRNQLAVEGWVSLEKEVGSLETTLVARRTWVYEKGPSRKSVRMCLLLILCGPFGCKL